MSGSKGNTESTLLILAPIGKDAELTCNLLRDAEISAESAPSLAEVTARLNKATYGGVILAEEALVEPAIPGLREFLASQAPWSDIPVVLLLSHHSAPHSQRGKFLLDLFAPSGNISLMERPFHPSTLVSSVRVSIRARRRQYEMRDLIEQLQFSLQQRENFMSAASHELKTPLTSLRLQTQMSIRAIASGDKGAFNEAKVLRNIQNTERHVSRLTRLIDEMLDVTRIQAGKLSLNLEQVDLRELVLDVMEVHQPQFKDTACTLRCTEPEVVGYWDRFRIEQVITNLLTNALKYGHGNPVELALRREGGFAILEVRDQGLGIAREDRDRIFGRFERAVSTSSISGLGLGLYITRHILELHRAHISVESEVGKGSVFQVKLPLEIETMNSESCMGEQELAAVLPRNSRGQVPIR